MKSTHYLVCRIGVVLLALSLVAWGIPSAQAYVTYSGGWYTVSQYPIPQKKIDKALGETIGTLRSYVDASVKSGKRATVVAGCHSNANDPRPHVTVRLYAGNAHVYTYHVYLNEAGKYTGQVDAAR
jgi:hypothetical protein